jgi:hypothetical protein
MITPALAFIQLPKRIGVRVPRSPILLHTA